MAAPNIVNVATITGITTYLAGINTGGDGVVDTVNPAGVSTVLTNASASGKVLKINSLVATAIGDTTGVTVQLFDGAGAHTAAAHTVSVATTMTVPLYSSLAVIDKTNSIYLQEGHQIGCTAQSNAGSIDIVCSYEDIS